MAEEFDNARVFDSLAECLRDADIVTTLTPSRKGFIKQEWLKESVLINAVGADAKGKRELDASVINHMGLIVYDEWEQCSHSGEIQYLSECILRPALFSLGEIVSGSLEYNNIDRTMGTLFDATGLAIEDIATARYVYERTT
jgi:alanine dehydrogenase